MLTRAALVCRHAAVIQLCTRQLGVTAACHQKAATATDPIQKLFLDKVREYNQKSSSAGGKMVDVTPQTEKALRDDLDKIDRVFGAAGPDFLKFPTFNFQDPTLEAVGVDVTIREPEVEAAAEQVEVDKDKPYWEV